MTIPGDDTLSLAEENELLRQRVMTLEARQAELHREMAVLSDAEERFRAFFDNAPIGKSMTAPDGTLLRVNRCLGAMLGYTEAELQQGSFRAVTHPDDVAASQECIRALMAGECEVWSMEKRYLAKDGHIVWARVVTRLQRDAQSRPLHLLTHIFDITEAKGIEQQLVAERTLLHNLIESAGSPIFSVDAEYKYTSFNAQHASIMKALYGVDIELGKSLLDYQRPTGDDQQTKRNLDRALTGESFIDEGYSGDDARTRSYFEVSHHPIIDPMSQIVGAAVLARDTTAKRRAEEELLRLNTELDQRVHERTAQLEEANRELNAFAYSVSHDLRAPLRAISGFTHILVEEYGPQLDLEGQRLCSVIRDSASKMGTLIDELLAFSRQSRALLNPVLVDMGELVQSVFDDLVPPAARARIAFQMKDLPAIVADRTLIGQVWENLLSNAIKFSAQLDLAHITVSAKRVEGAVQYAVADDGAGFDMRYADKLFGVFQRLHKSTEFDGNGVGLALVQRIIHRHGGKVWGQGLVGQGASFGFSLPDHRDNT